MNREGKKRRDISRYGRPPQVPPRRRQTSTKDFDLRSCLLRYFTSFWGEDRGNSVTGSLVYRLHTRVVPFSGNIGISFSASR
jgi:hypothetical protein